MTVPRGSWVGIKWRTNLGGPSYLEDKYLLLGCNIIRNPEERWWGWSYDILSLLSVHGSGVSNVLVTTDNLRQWVYGPASEAHVKSTRDTEQDGWIRFLSLENA